MRPQIKWLLTAVLAGLVVAPAVGQLPRLVGLQSILENGIGKPILLANKGVKKEIKLTDKQDKQVRKIEQEMFEKYQPQFRNALRDREKQAKLIKESTRETRERLDKALPDILRPEQLKRLNQIQIQVNGIGAFERSDVQEKLNLSIKQKVAILKIGGGLQKDIAEVFKDASAMPLRKMEAALHKIKELHQSATQKALEQLTNAQKQSWKELTGEKFDFKLELPIGRVIRR